MQLKGETGILRRQAGSMVIRVVMTHDSTGYYVAQVPAFPGCVSQGKTLAEAKANIREAIVGWLAVMNEKAKARADRTMKKALNLLADITIGRLAKRRMRRSRRTDFLSLEELERRVGLRRRARATTSSSACM